jgi:hypothetical protein
MVSRVIWKIYPREFFKDFKLHSSTRNHTITSIQTACYVVTTSEIIILTSQQRLMISSQSYKITDSLFPRNYIQNHKQFLLILPVTW